MVLSPVMNGEAMNGAPSTSSPSVVPRSSIRSRRFFVSVLVAIFGTSSGVFLAGVGEMREMLPTLSYL